MKKVKNSEKERRFFSSTDLRVDHDKNDEPVITGYSAVFNKLSTDLGGFKERIRTGAFSGALLRSDPRALFNHDENIILGRKSAGTLNLEEDNMGLHIEIKPPSTQLVRDMVLKPIERGDVREQSFGFIVEEDTWEGFEDSNKGDLPIRNILKVYEVFDVSPVSENITFS